MRKKLLLLAVSLLGMASAQAQTLKVANFEVLEGKTSNLVVGFNDATSVRDAQFDITVPTDVTLGTPVAPTGYTVAMSDATTVDGGKKYTVILYSADANTGVGDITFPVTATNNITGTYWDPLVSSVANGATTVSPNNSTVTENQMSTYPSYTFQIGLLGDANKSGSVNIADVSTIISAIIGGNPASYSELAANANETGDVNIADVSATISIITSGGAQ